MNTQVMPKATIMGDSLQLIADNMTYNLQLCDGVLTLSTGRGKADDGMPLDVALAPNPISTQYLVKHSWYKGLQFCFSLHPGSDAVGIQVLREEGSFPASGSAPAENDSGIEDDTTTNLDSKKPASVAGESVFCFTMQGHLRLTRVTFWDRTDVHNELVFEDEWLLHPADTGLSLCGNLFIVEDVLSNTGFIILKEAPLPHARPVKSDADLRVDVNRGQVKFTVLDTRCGGEINEGYWHTFIPFIGGDEGVTAALQSHQCTVRPYKEGRDGLFLTNTWGDRSRDARINQEYILQEAKAGARLGADIVQIDDGWQKGRTANSAQSSGVWEGFWEADNKFWLPDETRFPHGLEPIVEELSAHDMGLGLWFAPDSSKEFTNWCRDAETLISLHNKYGVRHFKIDGVKARTKTGEANLRRFFDKVLSDCSNIVFDLDVTAEIRPGYFGMMDIGPLFVENRYTDWHRYWPHHTLRNLWRLARYICPYRLRMEFLNNKRNEDVYGDDPLAPATYSPDYLFASVMFSSPLGWFEASNLDPNYIETVGALVEKWKRIRAEIFDSTILPIGQCPDGTSWTGFAALSGALTRPACATLLVFRELNDRCSWELSRPWLDCLRQSNAEVELLHGTGKVYLGEKGLTVEVPNPRSFILVRIAPPRRP